jgi:hypothetical protein
LSPYSTHLVFPLRKDTTDAASIICGRFITNTRADALRALRRIDVFERIPHGVRGYWTRIFDAHGVSQLVTFAKAYPLTKVNFYLECIEPGRTGYNVELFAELIEMIAQETPTPSLNLLGSTTRTPVFSLYTDHSNLKAVKEMTGVWSGYAMDAPVFPGNVVCRPGCVFQQSAWVNYYSYIYLPPLGNAWETVFNEWYTNGF